ncbi:DUF6884 domain-containing protein [Paraburkholderia sp. IW21]|uniref:DUF6884 domain-containing protein n=1 Tax=Paraburkholderia sp. IW21 TaxID=3242488 RepID=UPI003520BC04
MNTSEGVQGDFFELPIFDTLASLLSDDGKPGVVVIGCGRNKLKSAARVSHLYTSSRFQRSRAIAENLGARYFVLSAKHGLVAPDKIIEPYDFQIKNLSVSEKCAWARSALDSLATLAQDTVVTFLAESDYVDPLLFCNSDRNPPLNLLTPLKTLAPEQMPLWLEQAEQMSIRVRDLKKLYAIIDDARTMGLTFKFSNFSQARIPKRGVYVFLDPREQNFTKSGPRIVRIGTHAVSLESKSTLRTRLRSHFGQVDGAGNHRGSIFRLHVGRALLDSDELQRQYKTWGEGQHASAEVRENEVDHERKVSRYLSDLEVFVIPIDDEPSKDSLRAHFETQLIALCTENFEVIEKPSTNWLGRHSPMAPIVRSGLWNLRDVAKRYKPDDLGSISHLISIQGKQT